MSLLESPAEETWTTTAQSDRVSLGFRDCGTRDATALLASGAPLRGECERLEGPVGDSNSVELDEYPRSHRDR
jgi:hypothetical protein